MVPSGEKDAWTTRLPTRSMLVSAAVVSNCATVMGRGVSFWSLDATSASARYPEMSVTATVPTSSPLNSRHPSEDHSSHVTSRP